MAMVAAAVAVARRTREGSDLDRKTPSSGELMRNCSESGSDMDIQGDHSGCIKPPVDIKTKGSVYTKCNICFGVNGRFDTT